MCYFLHLEIAAQKQAAAVQEAVRVVAAQHDTHLTGAFPCFQITDGQCACRQVPAEGHAVKPIALLEEITRLLDVKHVRVGWTWAAGRDTRMKPDTDEVRLALAEFVSRNAAQELHPDTWYRLHAPDKYLW